VSWSYKFPLIVLIGIYFSNTNRVMYSGKECNGLLVFAADGFGFY